MQQSLRHDVNKNVNFILWLLAFVYLICNNYALIIDKDKDDEIHYHSTLREV